MSLKHRLQSLYKTAHKTFDTLNLFDSKSSNITIVHREKLTTRLFLFLFLVLIIILLIYTSFRVQVKSETIEAPTQSVYENLRKKYADTLECLCEKISIPYGKFVNITPSFHQVCSSDFVKQNWIDFTFEIDRTSIWPIDIRQTLSSLWRLIATLCQTSINTTNNALDQFTDSPLTSLMILPEELLKAKMEANLEDLRQISSATLTRPLTFIQRIIQANLLLLYQRITLLSQKHSVLMIFMVRSMIYHFISAYSEYDIESMKQQQQIVLVKQTDHVQYLLNFIYIVKQNNMEFMI